MIKFERNLLILYFLSVIFGMITGIVYLLTDIESFFTATSGMLIFSISIMIFLTIFSKYIERIQSEGKD